MTASNLAAALAIRMDAGRALWRSLSGRWQVWRRIRRSRRELNRLSEDQLTDIGLKRTPTGYDAQTELRARDTRLLREMSKTWGYWL
jgi:uncharacterized protein YjiS (DUF1127 family)